MYSYFKHPNNLKMSYFQHFLISLKYSRKLFTCSIKALIHAFIPFLFTTSTTSLVMKLNSEILMFNNK